MENLKELATGLAFPEGPIAMLDGSVLLVEIKRGTLTRVCADGKVEVVAQIGGGPNGAAIGPAITVVLNGTTETGFYCPVINLPITLVAESRPLISIQETSKSFTRTAMAYH